MSKQTAIFKDMILAAGQGSEPARKFCKDMLIRCIENEDKAVPDYVLLKLSECLVECFLDECREWSEQN